MLASSFDRRKHSANQRISRKRPLARPRRLDRAAHQDRPQPSRRAKNRVAFGHLCLAPRIRDNESTIYNAFLDIPLLPPSFSAPSSILRADSRYDMEASSVCFSDLHLDVIRPASL
jgi:hypothetical protein